jgi:hypothetical protein
MDTSYAPYGELRFVGGRVVCHICGDEWDSLSAHVWQTHELRAEEYRALFGIPHAVGLVGPDSSARRRRDMRRRLRADPEMMERLRAIAHADPEASLASLRATIKRQYDDGRRHSKKVTVRCRWCRRVIDVYPSALLKAATTTCGDPACVRQQKVAVGRENLKRWKEKWERDAEFRERHRAQAQEAGRAAGRARRYPTGVCINCGVPGLRYPRKTCSDECLFEGRRRVASRNAGRSCEIEGCSAPHLARGRCAKHYQRLQKARRVEVATTPNPAPVPAPFLGAFDGDQQP